MAKHKAKRKKSKRFKTARRKRSGSKTKRDWGEALAIAALVAGLWLPSLIVMPGIADEFRLPKLAASEALMLLSVLLLALARNSAAMAVRARSALLVAVPILSAAVFSFALSEHADHGRIALWNLVIGVVVLLGWSSRGLELERVLTWLAVPAAVAAVLIFVQRFGSWQPFELETERSRLQLTAMIGNVGEAALFVSLPMAVCWVKAYRALVQRRNIPCAVWTTVGLLLLGAVVLTQTATAIVAAAAGLGALAVLLPMARPMRLAVVGAAITVLILVLLTPPGERFRSKAKNLVRGEFAELTTGRTDGWNAARYMLQQRPLTGVGLGAFVAEFTPAKEAQLAAGVEYYDKHVGRSTFSNAHNEPLEWAAETGWLGLGLLALSLAIFARCVYRRYLLREAGLSSSAAATDQFESQMERALALTTVLMLALGALTYFPLRTALLAYPVLIILAALLSDAPAADTAEASTDGEPANAVRSNLAWGAAVVVLALLAASISVSTKRIRSSAQLLLAESTADSMMSQNRVYPTVLRPLIGSLVAAGEDAPWDERIPLALGSYHRLLREPEQAVEWYQRSLQIAPRPETIWNLGKALMELDRQDEAIVLFERSVRLDPLRSRALPESVADQVLAATGKGVLRGRRAKPKAASQ